VRRIVLCTGKVWHDLNAARTEREVADVALVRIELLYPWPEAALSAVLGRYPNEAEVLWCQEEPANMGAYAHARWRCARIAGYAGRVASASPATGSLQTHKLEQARLVAQALGK
jgi:2-oxoglutarate dehydrogenase E1 component